MNKIKNKKTLIIILLLIVTIGITIAFFSNSTILENLFGTKEYGTTYTEEFISPDNWLPGDTTDKTLVVTNSGKVDEAVRISYTEEWISKNGTTLSGLIDENGQLTDEEENSERAVIINFSNLDDWTYNDGYYYYKYRLAPNEETSSFIESVTFNPNVTLGNTCTEEETPTGKRIQCNSSGEDYDNATYKLTFTIETVQFNKYSSAWGVDIALAENRQLFCDAFEVGEVVDYKGSEYYVLKDSSTEDDYVTLIKKDLLTADEVNTYSTDYVSQNGEYPYFESDTCNENTQTGCSTNYDTSSVKKIIDGWSSSFGDDLVEIDGYKTRLINENDYSNYIYYQSATPSNNAGYRFYSKYNYLYSSDYWTITTITDSNDEITAIQNIYLYSEKVYNKLSIRPVINIKKSAINGACSRKNDSLVSLQCYSGDLVTYHDNEFYVLEDSSLEQEFVTLLKKEPLTAEEVNAYSADYISQNGEYPYFESNTCNENTRTGCKSSYDTSDVKILLEKWTNNFRIDLKKENGYRVRLITVDEIVDKLYYNYNYSSPMTFYTITDDTPSWAYIDTPFWTMTTYLDAKHNNNDYEVYGVREYVNNEKIYNKLHIRPVINLKKSAVEGGCRAGDNNNNNYTSNSLGETVNYNNTNYCVINENKNKDYVTLIKSDPLTYDELVTYNNGYEIGRNNDYNDIGIVSFYKSDNCYYNSDNDKNLNGCNSSYNDSFIKNIVNNWSSSISNDLKEVNGYKARLISISDLFGLGYSIDNHVTQNLYLKTDDVPECIYNSNYIYNYWTMSRVEDSNKNVYIVNKDGKISGYYGDPRASYFERDHEVYSKNAVRPVINLKKCALNNTCE